MCSVTFDQCNESLINKSIVKIKSHTHAECFPLFAAPLAVRCYSHTKVETDEEFDSRWVTYFSKPDLDAWELRKGEDHTHTDLTEGVSFSSDRSRSPCSKNSLVTSSATCGNAEHTHQ